MVILVCLALTAKSARIVEMDCDHSTGSDDCLKVLPYCMKYAIDDDPQNEGRTVFSCLECEPGFEPIEGGIKNVPADLFLPDLKAMKVDHLGLCRRISTSEAGVLCNTPQCIKQLPNCWKYTYTKESRNSGTFKCLECHELFVPRSDLKETINATIDFSIQVLTCTRKIESRQCGKNCHLEFPGCSKIEVRDAKIVNYRSQEMETGKFYCSNEAEHFLARQLIFEGSTNQEIPKLTTIPAYQSHIRPCTGTECIHALPKCLTFSTKAELLQDAFIYKCHQCMPGYAPVADGRYFPWIAEMARTQQYAQVCEAVETPSAVCDDRCRLELPGCEIFSISNPSYVLGPYLQTATYDCLQCLPGYRKSKVEKVTPVQKTFSLRFNVKVRCAPIDVSQPTECDEYCRLKLPHCKKFTSKIDAKDPDTEESYRCHECDEGYEPAVDGVYAEWYTGDIRPVCNKKPTNGPLDCDETCQKEFPRCQRISITEDSIGHNIYKCDQCAPGFYPIQYEPNAAGVLSNKDSDMRDQATIYLCAETPAEIYLNMYICTSRDAHLVDHLECADQPNCRHLVKVWDLAKGGRLWHRCVQCKAGYKLKTAIPHIYDIDQDQCEPATLGTVSRLFVSTK